MLKHCEQMQLGEERIASLPLYSPLMKEDSLEPQVKNLEAGTHAVVMEESWWLLVS